MSNKDLFQVIVKYTNKFFQVLDSMHRLSRTFLQKLPCTGGLDDISLFGEEDFSEFACMNSSFMTNEEAIVM